MVERMPKKSQLTVDDYIERIHPEIRHCVYCQPYDDGEPVWVFGNRTNLEDLFDEHHVPERMRDDVADGLVCPGCSAQLSRWADVGVKHDFEEAHDRRIGEARRRYESSLLKFQSYLRDYPYLGAGHPVGRRILKEIGSFPAQQLIGRTWFRARRVASGRRVTTADMFPPDPSRISIPEGRYNHAGQAYWYLASTPEAASAEAAGPSEELAWVQSFKIEALVKILDVRAWEAEDERFLDEEGNPREVPLIAVALVFTDQLVEWVARDAPQKAAYNVPRFVADAARKAGFEGILFRSPRHFDDNLVLFDRNLRLRPVREPKLITIPDHLIRIQEEGLFFMDGFPMLPFPRANMEGRGV